MPREQGRAQPAGAVVADPADMCAARPGWPGGVPTDETLPSGFARDTGRGGEVGGEEADEIDRPRSVGGDAAARRSRGAGRARVSGRGGEAAGDEEDEIDELRAVGGGAAARDEAGAAIVENENENE